MAIITIVISVLTRDPAYDLKIDSLEKHQSLYTVAASDNQNMLL